MRPFTHSSKTTLISIIASLFLFCLLSQATTAEIERRGNVASVSDQNHGAVCDASTGELDYHDCLKTIWTMPGDPDQSSYKGGWILFPPAGIGYHPRLCTITIMTTLHFVLVWVVIR